MKNKSMSQSTTKRACCHKKIGNNTQYNHNPLDNYAVSLQQALRRKTEDSRKLKNKIIVLQDKQAQLQYLIETTRKKTQDSKRQVSHEKCNDKLQKLQQKFKNKINDKTQQIQQLKHQLHTLRTDRARTSRIDNRQTVNEFQNCTEAKHSTCCISNSLALKLQIVQALDENQQLKRKQMSIQRQKQKLENLLSQKQGQIKSTKKEHQRKYVELLDQLRTLVQKLKA